MAFARDAPLRRGGERRAEEGDRTGRSGNDGITVLIRIFVRGPILYLWDKTKQAHEAAIPSPRGLGAKGVRTWWYVILVSALEVAAEFIVNCEGDSPQISDLEAGRRSRV